MKPDPNHLPCPRCGGDPLLTVGPDISITCLCGFEGPIAPTYEAAWQAWNALPREEEAK